ncbi:stealth family protein [Streptomyces bambusae]|uniref:stealth family protein n=1 Tax=Streptomyces bambusae TaxID=1550616 RepID=UPI001CFCC52A|nr:stealth family protein [Streptomyces bambusae]MCB5164647.1 stealth family protein [Streptomyces bambusae]
MSWWVRAYRRGLPVQARRALAGCVAPQTRRQVKARLAAAPSAGQAVAGLRTTWEARRFPEVSTGRGRVLCPVEGVPRAVAVVPDLSPFQARARNLSAVCSALDRAGVDYFAVRGLSDTAATVGVAADDRPAVFEALAELCKDHPAYVSSAGVPRRKNRGGRGWLPATWRGLAQADVIRLTQYYGSPDMQLVLGRTYGCDIEFWTRTDGQLIAPRPNRTTAQVPLAPAPVEVSDALFTGLSSPFAGPAGSPRLQVRSRAEFAAPPPEGIRFPIDAVYTWVDGGDPDWMRRRAEAGGTGYHAEAANAARYISRDELRYSLRSLHQHAPWIRTVHLVTDDQTPDWLDTSGPGLRVVSHRDIFSDPALLPTFNSHAIESQLHHIDGLSEHFLYFNDDVFLGLPTVPQDFFHANGISKFFTSSALVPLGTPCEDDPPVAAAGKNNRSLLQSRFGTTLTQKMKHTPHALRRSILTEIEETFPRPHTATAGNRFRSIDDLSITSSLYHYYAFQSARAVPGDLRYDYLDLSQPNTPTRLDRLLAHRDRHVFCINDTVSTGHDADEQQALLGPFLETYFPVAGPFERGNGTRGARPGGTRE